MRIKIEVTEKDIRTGECKDPWKCAIAKAFNRALKTRTAAVGTGDIDFKRGGKKFQFVTPLKCSRFIEAFDQKKKVKPFTFTLNIPKEALP